MNPDLRSVVRRAIHQLRQEIDRKSSELASLKQELARHEKVQDLLEHQNGRMRDGKVRVAERRAPAARRMDWNALYKRLPGSFSVGNVLELAKNKPKLYAYQAVAKWVRQRRVKRLGRGKYQKVQA